MSDSEPALKIHLESTSFAQMVRLKKTLLCSVIDNNLIIGVEND